MVGKGRGVIPIGASGAKGRQGLGAQALAALGAAAGQHFAAVGGLHASAEAMAVFTDALAGLVRFFGGHGQSPNRVTEGRLPHPDPAVNRLLTPPLDEAPLAGLGSAHNRKEHYHVAQH